MKFKTLIWFALILLFACNNKSTDVSPSPNAKDTVGVVAPDTAKLISAFIKDLENTAGKKPSDIDLFDRYELTPRLQKMMGAEYSQFKSDWNEESVIKKDGPYLYFTGCKKNACKENRYFIVFDLLEDNINVFNFKNKMSRSFEEGAIIGMSYKIADEFEKILKEQNE